MRLRTDILAALAALAIASPIWSAADAPPALRAASHIEFVESIDEALVLVGDAPRPIVVHFGADWCGWCRRLKETTLTDATILAMADRFAWVHIDVDAEPAVAKTFGARALPHTVAIDLEGRVLAEVRGFADAQRYAAFLARAEAAFVPPAESEAKPLDAEELRKRVDSLIAAMAPPTATGRQQALAAIRRLGPAALPTLVELLGSEGLAKRAAAAFALSDLAERSPPFDPMADATVRAEQVAAWRAWLATPAAEYLRAPAAAPAPSARPVA
jgi:thiol-disulfide isomerase/thioredoxin